MKMTNLFCALFNIQAENFAEQNRVFTKEENDEVKAENEINFSRKKVTSNFLSTSGIKSMKTILHFISKKFTSIKYCPILPKVVQLFLWYVPEKVCLKIVESLLEEHFKLEKDTGPERNTKGTIKYFSTSLMYEKMLRKFALKGSKIGEDKHKVNALIEELIDNMCINVLPLEVK
jgi:hypothetical protein